MPATSSIKRRQALLDLAEQKGIWEINYPIIKQFAAKHNVHMVTVYRDLKIMNKESAADLKDANKTINILLHPLKKVLKYHLEILNTEYQSERNNKGKFILPEKDREFMKHNNEILRHHSATGIRNTVDSFTKFLENFKLKEKVAEKQLIEIELEKRLELVRKDIHLFRVENASDARVKAYEPKQGKDI